MPRDSTPRLLQILGVVLVLLLAPIGRADAIPGPAGAIRAAPPEKSRPPVISLDPARVDAAVQKALGVWQAPGMAVVIVSGDEVLYLRGHGVRRTGERDPVTPDTIFPFGSLTKAFVATTLGLLVADGKAGWDDRVRKHLPWFHLSDPLADREVRLRDLLCHRTGLGRHEFLWYRAPWSVEESVRRMAHLEQHTSFRSTFEYNNLGYLAAGLAITQAAGHPWPEVVQKRLLDPLEMKATVFTRSAALKASDHATPHRRTRDGKVVPIPWYPDDTQVRASGSLKGSARDLSQWVRVQLEGGRRGNKVIIPAEILAETRTAQVAERSEPGVDREIRTLSSYGLGWHLRDYRGHAVIEHSGANDGFRARVILLPRERLGIALLTNLEETACLTATGDTLVDRLLGLEPHDWHTEHLARVRKAQAAQQETFQKRLATRRPGTKPSRELAAYAGTYRDAAYGSLEVTRDEAGLTLKWSSFSLPLRHFHFDTFLTGDPKDVGTDRLLGELATFHLNTAGEVSQVRFLGRTFERKMGK
jgi:CubicO group peptidase (beta-lactamase class C family)